MGHYHRDTERVCIRTRKIYDWVTRQIDVPLKSFSGDDLETIFPSDTCPGDGTICDFLAAQNMDPQTLPFVVS